MTDASSKALFDTLREAKKKDEQEQNIDWKTEREEWVADVSALFNDVRQWLEPAIKEGLVRVTSNLRQVSEEYLGTYGISSLTLAMPEGRLVEMIPVGRIVVGARGRVDIVSGPKTVMLLRVGPKRWKFRDPLGKQLNLRDLTETTFADTLRELIA